VKPSAAILFALVGIPLHAQTQSSSAPLRVSFPGQSWAVQILAPGFNVTQNATQQDGRRYLSAENDSSGAEVSITIEKVSKPATPDGCLEVFQTRLDPDGPFRLTDVHQSQIGEMAVLEYVIPEFNRAPIRQKNIFGCLAKDSFYVDVHVSKEMFDAADEAPLIAILSTTRTVDVSASENANSLPEGSAAFFSEGTRHFQLQEYDQAIEAYRQALDLEKGSRKLDASKWRTLVDNLAMSYGITGDFKAAEDVLNYGLSQDATYPMFYFILADAYAERNDLPNTLKNLRLALKFKANVIAGEKLPNPLSDDSFKRFWENAEFMKLADEFE